jgi:hypothetical protein
MQRTLAIGKFVVGRWAGDREAPRASNVYHVLENLAAAASHQEILTAYPELTADDIDAALTYASERSGR